MKNDNIAVSIIVPVYNVYDYLDCCISSFVKQTFHSYEILIIHDGSTDNCQEITDDYAIRYPKLIRSFAKENEGLGLTRNFGIKQAKGEYLFFVDSDDWVPKNAVAILYEKAIKCNSDYVLGDYIASNGSDKKDYCSSMPPVIFGESKTIDKKTMVRYSTMHGSVLAPAKLVKKSLFKIIDFPTGRYEDLATIPIILSFAENPTYLNRPCYFYRNQRQGSLTDIKAFHPDHDRQEQWNRIKKFANPDYSNEICYAIYWNLNENAKYFNGDYVLYYSQKYYLTNKAYFQNNNYIEEDIRKGYFRDFNTIPQIPKIIHYCWFGGNPKNELILSCIESWREHNPDYEIMEWNESNCDINETEYTKQAYQAKKWAFVSDYYRLKALYYYGGFYLDTDMMALNSLAPFLCNKVVLSFEFKHIVNFGIAGAVKNSDFIFKLINTYKNDTFEQAYTLPLRITEFLSKNHYGLVKNGLTQILEDDIKINTPNVFTVDAKDGYCVTKHLYEGSWLNGKAQDYYTEVLNHYLNEIANPNSSKLYLFYRICHEFISKPCFKHIKPYVKVVFYFFKNLLRK